MRKKNRFISFLTVKNEREKNCADSCLSLEYNFYFTFYRYYAINYKIKYAPEWNATKKKLNESPVVMSLSCCVHLMNDHNVYSRRCKSIILSTHNAIENKRNQSHEVPILNND